MSSPGRRTTRIRLSRCTWAALAVGVSMFLVTVAEPALAHSDLVSSDPADGSTVSEPPREVVLTFNEDVQDTGSAVVVTGPDDERIDDPAALRVDGARVTATVDPEVPGGVYTAAYRVVSADGHVISGTVEYRLDLPASSPTPSATPDPTSADPTPSGTSPTALPATPAAGSGTSSRAPWWVALLAVVGAAAATVTVVVRRSRQSRG